MGGLGGGGGAVATMLMALLVTVAPEPLVAWNWIESDPATAIGTNTESTPVDVGVENVLPERAAPLSRTLPFEAIGCDDWSKAVTWVLTEEGSCIVADCPEARAAVSVVRTGVGGGGGAVAVTTRVAVSETTLPETSCRLYVSAIGNGVTRVTVNTPAASVGPQFEFSRGPEFASIVPVTPGSAAPEADRASPITVIDWVVFAGDGVTDTMLSDPRTGEGGGEGGGGGDTGGDFGKR